MTIMLVPTRSCCIRVPELPSLSTHFLDKEAVAWSSACYPIQSSSWYYSGAHTLQLLVAVPANLVVFIPEQGSYHNKQQTTNKLGRGKVTTSSPVVVSEASWLKRMRTNNVFMCIYIYIYIHIYIHSAVAGLLNCSLVSWLILLLDFVLSLSSLSITILKTEPDNFTSTALPSCIDWTSGWTSSHATVHVSTKHGYWR